ncbi:hypothetical protein [Azospirillum argentinense]
MRGGRHGGASGGSGRPRVSRTDGRAGAPPWADCPLDLDCAPPHSSRS